MFDEPSTLLRSWKPGHTDSSSISLCACPCAKRVRRLPHPAQLLGDADAGRAATRTARCDRSVHREHPRTAGVSADRPGPVPRRSARRDPRREPRRTRTHAPAARAPTERDTLAHHPFRDVGGEREPCRGQLRHPSVWNSRVETSRGSPAATARAVRPNRRPAPCPPADHGCTRGAAPERREQTGHVADEASGLAASELGDVRILLLRHDRRTRRPRVRERDVAEFRCAPNDDLFAIRDRSTAIIARTNAPRPRSPRRRSRRSSSRQPSRSSARRDGVGIQAQRRTRESTETYGDTAARLSKSRSRCTARNSGWRVCEQMMRQQPVCAAAGVSSARITASGCAAACVASASTTSRTPSAMRRTASRSHMRNSVAT